MGTDQNAGNAIDLCVIVPAAKDCDLPLGFAGYCNGSLILLGDLY